MSAMTLNAILKMDTGPFRAAAGAARANIKALAAAGVAAVGGISLGAAARNVAKAFDFGAELRRLGAATGETAGDLAALRRAFADAGVGGESLGQVLGTLRKHLGAIGPDGKPSVKMFGQLGLNVRELQGMDAEGQLAAIGNAIARLGSPAQQSAAAMAVFGNQGNAMLAMLKNPDAIDSARRSLGSLPGVLERSGPAFEMMSQRIAGVKQQGDGFWAGFAEGMLPLADSVTGLMGRFDFAGLGGRAALFLGTFAEMVKSVPAGDYLEDGITLALKEIANRGPVILAKIGESLWKILSWPVAALQAAFQKVIEEMMEMIGKIPLVGKKAGLEGFEAGSFSEMFAEARQQQAGRLDTGLNWGDSMNTFDTSRERASLAKVWEAAGDTFKESVREVRDTAAEASKKTSGGASETTTLRAPAASSAPRIDADSLTRIGGYTQGSQNLSKQLNLAERTAKATEATAQALRSGTQQAVWGN